eukprot:2225695-Prymnesium_polylepis.1
MATDVVDSLTSPPFSPAAPAGATASVPQTVGYGRRGGAAPIAPAPAPAPPPPRVFGTSAAPPAAAAAAAPTPAAFNPAAVAMRFGAHAADS